MHQAASPRKTVAAPIWDAPGIAFAALVVANVALAFGPWFVRLADVGPVAAGFWRIAMRPLPALSLSSAATVLPLLGFAALLHETIVPHRWSPLVIGIALLIQPVIAGAIGWVEYGERLQGPDRVGVALVAIALVLARRGEVAPPRPQAQEAAVQEMEA